MNKTDKNSIMIVAGEASGDVHGAAVVRALLEESPAINIFGMGGSELRNAGMETVVDSEVYASVMGVTEVVKNIDKIFKAFNLLLKEAKERKPAVVILIDYPDFNLRLAKKLRAEGIKVLYYICPQVWAWRQSRVHTIAKVVDKIASIFPFETEFYRKHNVPVEFVGHPFVDRRLPQVNKERFLTESKLSPLKSTVALLPGSRRAEIEKLFPVMIDSYSFLSKKYDLQAIVPIAPSLEADWVRSFAKNIDNISFVSGNADKVMMAADAAVVASGTASMEAALVGNPFCVIYKVSPFTYFLGRLLIRGVDYIAMPNIIAGWGVVTELLQEEVTVEKLSAELESLLFDKQRREGMRASLLQVRDALSYQGKAQEIGASSRVARMALELASERG